MITDMFSILYAMIDIYKLKLLFIIAILIILRKTIYPKNIFIKILFWGILIATICYGLAVFIVLMVAASMAPSFAQS